jgi:hypothetical protein
MKVNEYLIENCQPITGRVIAEVENVKAGENVSSSGEEEGSDAEEEETSPASKSTTTLMPDSPRRHGNATSDADADAASGDNPSITDDKEKDTDKDDDVVQSLQKLHIVSKSGKRVHDRRISEEEGKRSHGHLPEAGDGEEDLLEYYKLQQA